MKKHSIIIGSIIGIGLLLTATGASAIVGGFRDVPNNHWAATAIQNLKNSGIIMGYEDGTFRPNNPVTRAEVVIMLEKNNEAIKRQMDVLEDRIEAIQKERREDQTESETWGARLSRALRSNANVREITNPNLNLPSDIHEGQLNRFFSLGDDVRLATVLTPSGNIDLSGRIPRTFTPSYGGILIADRNDNQWHKLTRIRDTDPASSAGNNAYYFWTHGGNLMLGVVDPHGASKGEGIQKVYSTSDGQNWLLDNCYYFGNNTNSPNFSRDVLNNEETYYSYSRELNRLGGVSDAQRTACENDVTFTNYY